MFTVPEGAIAYGLAAGPSHAFAMNCAIRNMKRAAGGQAAPQERANCCETRHQPMPPMLLLPLVRWALAGGSAQRLRIAIERRPASLVIEVESDAAGDDAVPVSEIACVRERLAQLYAFGARLSVESRPGPRRALLEIPRRQIAAAQLARAA